MKKIGTTGILFVVAVAVAAGVSGAYLFFFAAMKGKAESATEISVRAEDTRTKQGKLSVILAALKGESEHINKLDGYFIKEREIVSFAKSLELVGTSAGAVMTIEALTPQTNKDNTSTLSIRLKAVGKFANLMRALELLENFPAKIEWSSVDILREDAETAPIVKGKNAAPQIIFPVWKLTMTGTALNFIRE
jgi:predicted O-linked N-acetylglucosamine transferase (SPINDLY family)